MSVQKGQRIVKLQKQRLTFIMENSAQRISGHMICDI